MAASPPHTDGSVVFARWRQCAPNLTFGSLVPPDPRAERCLDRFSRFCTVHRTESLYFTMGHPLPPQSCSFAWGSGPPSNIGPHGSLNTPESAVFTGLTIVTDRQSNRQTDHATRSVSIGHIYVLRCSLIVLLNMHACAVTDRNAHSHDLSDRSLVIQTCSKFHCHHCMA